MKHNTLKAITGKKKRLLEVLTDGDTDSVFEICRRANISVPTYYRYINDPEFAHIITLSVERACTMRLPMTVTALNKQAEKGNVQAIRTVLELKGMLNAGSKQSVNIYQEQPQATTQTYKDSQEAIEDIDKRIEELQAIRQGQVNRLEAHAIHPSTDKGTE